MGDAQLREHARRAHEMGAPADALRHARELERAGRSEDALAALLSHREDAAVRREIGRLEGARRSTVAGFIDARPIEKAPRVRWVAPWPDDVDAGPEGATHFAFLAHPLGIYVGACEAWGLVLDPDTGARRHVVAPPGKEPRWTETLEYGGEVGATGRPWIKGDALFRSRDAGLVADDLWTGERRDLSTVSRSSSFVSDERGFVRIEDATVRAYDWPDPAREPALRWSWAAPADACVDDGGWFWRERPRRIVARDVVYVHVSRYGRERSTHALDRETGRLLWERREDLMFDGADDEGAFLWDVERALRIAVDSRGREVWTRAHDDSGNGDRPRVELASPLVAVEKSDPWREYRVFDRATGARLFALAEGWPLAIVRSVLFSASRTTIFAHGAHDGRLLWSSSLPAPPSSNGLSPGPMLFDAFDDRVFVLLGDGAVVCLEQEGTEPSR